MQQVLINTPATVKETWYEDGVASDPGTVTVTVTRADGTEIVTDAATTPVAAFTGDSALKARAYNLSIASNALLGPLALTWESATLGTLTSYVEVVGGFYFSIAEFKARYSDNPKAQSLTAAEIATARSAAEDIIEHETRRSFVPRAKILNLSGANLVRASVPIYHLRAVDSITIDDEVQTDVSTYRVAAGGLYRTTSFPSGVSNVRVQVSYGLDSPPPRIKEAAMTLAYHRAVKGPIDDRATSIPAGEAGGTITLLTPGVGAAITGIPEVDSAILSYRLPDPGAVGSVSTTDYPNDYASADTWAVG